MAKKLDTSKYPAVLEAISTGLSVRKACEQAGVAETTFRANVDAAQYARAREACAHSIAEEILEIADNGKNDWMEQNGREDVGWVLNGEHVQRSKLRVDARKWLLSKIAPKSYGDKQAIEHSGPDGTPIQHQNVFSEVSDEQLFKILQAAGK